MKLQCQLLFSIDMLDCLSLHDLESWSCVFLPHAGEYRPDMNVNLVKGVVDKAAVGKTDTFGSTVPRCASLCDCSDIRLLCFFLLSVSDAGPYCLCCAKGTSTLLLVCLIPVLCSQISLLLISKYRSTETASTRLTFCSL